MDFGGSGMSGFHWRKLLELYALWIGSLLVSAAPNGWFQRQRRGRQDTFTKTTSLARGAYLQAAKPLVRYKWCWAHFTNRPALAPALIRKNSSLKTV